MVGLLRKLGLLLGKSVSQSSTNIQSLPQAEVNDYDAAEMAALEGGLELERRLYESVQASLETTTVREGLLATFLTSGAIVAVASAAEAIAQVASGLRFSISCVAISLITVALILMGVSFRQTLRLFQGHEVQDLTKAKRFVELALQGENPTRRDVILQLTTEYSEARERLNDFVNTRYAVLWKAMLPIGIAVVFAILAAQIAILDASRPRDTSDSNKTAEVPYTRAMRRPIQYPQGGGGTTVTKGGGGSGGSTKPSTPRPSGGQRSSQ
jgi:hypothetical protein